MNMYSCFVIILLVISVNASELDELYGHPEESCSRAGGLCIKKTECENLVQGSGLCPTQQSNGIECCQGVPKSETRCQKLGGECMKKNTCKPNLQIKKANNCASNQDCCLLL